MFEFPEVPESLRLIVLAVLQGIAEFLPISSSGHLNVFSTALGGEPSTLVNIALHAGTLLSILIFYRKRIMRLLAEDRRVILLLIVGTIPAAVIGVTIKKVYPWLLEDLLLTGVMFVITGLALVYFHRIARNEADAREKKADKESSAGKDSLDSQSAERLDYVDLSIKAVLFIGLFQAFALMPGISRSGFTILAGILMGLKHKSAGTFSFLLAIPAILGATVLELLDLFETPPTENLGMVCVAAVVAFFVGLASLALLVKMIDRGQLHWFALWVLPLGFLVILWRIYQQLSELAG